MTRFSDQKILLTGASRGIGHEMARLLLGWGATLLLPARDVATLAPLVQIAPDRVHSVQTDLAQSDQTTALADWVYDKHPDCAGLVNNAAIMIHTTYTADTPMVDQITTEVAINLTAPLTLCAHLLPLLADQRDGFICNVTSGLALSPKTDAATYSATKAGLRGFTRGLRNQALLSGLKITINEAVLPVVNTSLSTGDPARKMPPDQAAAAILTGIQKSRRETYIGKARLLHHILRASPALGHAIMARI